MKGENMKVTIKKLDENAKTPTYGTDFSAGADLYALIQEGEREIRPGEIYLVHTGISLEIPEGYGGFIFARSGLATKKAVAPANKVGVIDSDYRGEIMVPLLNSGTREAVIANGERIAQIVFMQYGKASFELSEELSDTERGEGGFGSTGKK